MAATDPGPDADRAVQVAEPYPGYRDADVTDIEKTIAKAPEGRAREDLKAAIRAAENQQDKPRKGVLAATAPVVEPQPGVAGLPTERPDLIEVAQERAANRKVRVISTRKED